MVEEPLMLRGLLLRGPSTDQGTFGQLFLHNFQCFTTELPDRNNASQISRIPAGEYLCKWRKSPKFGWCYHVTGVPDRGNILIHAGNYAGAVDRGYLSHSHGCILPCARLGKLARQSAGLVSRPAVRKLAEIMQGQDFLLEVRNA